MQAAEYAALPAKDARARVVEEQNYDVVLAVSHKDPRKTVRDAASSRLLVLEKTQTSLNGVVTSSTQGAAGTEADDVDRQVDLWMSTVAAKLQRLVDPTETVEPVTGPSAEPEVVGRSEEERSHEEQLTQEILRDLGAEPPPPGSIPMAYEGLREDPDFYLEPDEVGDQPRAVEVESAQSDSGLETTAPEPEALVTENTQEEAVSVPEVYTCSKCGHRGPLSDFGTRNCSGKIYRQPQCRPCRREAWSRSAAKCKRLGVERLRPPKATSPSEEVVASPPVVDELPPEPGEAVVEPAQASTPAVEAKRARKRKGSSMVKAAAKTTSKRAPTRTKSSRKPQAAAKAQEAVAKPRRARRVPGGRKAEVASGSTKARKG